MTAREYLEQIGYLKRKIHYLELEAEEYERLSLSIPGPNYEREIVDCTRNLEAPFVKWLDKKFETIEKIKKTQTKLEEVKMVAADAISKLDNVEYRLVLTYRYFDGLTWPEICIKVNFAKQTVYRYHLIALDLLKIPGIEK